MVVIVDTLTNEIICSMSLSKMLLLASLAHGSRGKSVVAGHAMRGTSQSQVRGQTVPVTFARVGHFVLYVRFGSLNRRLVHGNEDDKMGESLVTKRTRSYSVRWHLQNEFYPLKINFFTSQSNSMLCTFV